MRRAAGRLVAAEAALVPQGHCSGIAAGVAKEGQDRTAWVSVALAVAEGSLF